MGVITNDPKANVDMLAKSHINNFESTKKDNERVAVFSKNSSLMKQRSPPRSPSKLNEDILLEEPADND